MQTDKQYPEKVEYLELIRKISAAGRCSACDIFSWITFAVVRGRTCTSIIFSFTLPLSIEGLNAGLIHYHISAPINQVIFT